ncbi:hypothetical protein HGB13_02870, partial [bacterium]|nr:hypothetical protein [bacterium]
MLTEQKENIQKVKDKILKSEKIALFTHRDPDGDAIGSISSIYRALTDSGRSVYPFLFGDLPSNFLHLSLPIFIKEKVSEDFD